MQTRDSNCEIQARVREIEREKVGKTNYTPARRTFADLFEATCVPQCEQARINVASAAQSCRRGANLREYDRY